MKKKKKMKKNDDTLGNIESVRHMRLKAHRPPTDQKKKIQDSSNVLHDTP